jgi:hypothetical protein
MENAVVLNIGYNFCFCYLRNLFPAPSKCDYFFGYLRNDRSQWSFLSANRGYGALWTNYLYQSSLLNHERWLKTHSTKFRNFQKKILGMIHVVAVCRQCN